MLQNKKYMCVWAEKREREGEREGEGETERD